MAEAATTSGALAFNSSHAGEILGGYIETPQGTNGIEAFIAARWWLWLILAILILLTAYYSYREKKYEELDRNN